MQKNRTYIAIDLKSFYASVECVSRGLDPLTARLVVADSSRTEKTICLAVSPALKALGIPGRPRLFEVFQRVRELNSKQRDKLDFVIAPPHMALYVETSLKIHDIYLKYVSSEDIHVYSIDEVFMDVTDYLESYKLSARQLAMNIILDVLTTTGITATAGIGSNLYLCKVAMDVMAKHIPADKNGVRIAELDEKSYRQELWTHRPITDFWRIGPGYADKLARLGLCTMGDVALYSTRQGGEDMLYKLFGVNAELLIDHAWGWEPCTMRDVKEYRPEVNSLSSGQVLKNPYDFDSAALVLREMAEQLSLELVDKRLTTSQISITVGYDVENLSDPVRRRAYKGEVTSDHYGRPVPKHAHGTEGLGRQTASTKLLTAAAMRLFERIVDKKLLVRRLNIVAEKVEPDHPEAESTLEQLSLFTDYDALESRRAKEEAELEKEKRLQKAEIAIKKRFGKNSILKGMNFEEGATAIERNTQIGGHKA